MTRKIKLLLLLCCLFPWLRANAAIGTSVGSGSICPGDEVVVPVTVSSCNDVAAISLALSYDTTKVSYLGYQNMNANLTGMLVNQVKGTIYLSWANASAVNLGDAILLELRFQGITGSTGLNWNTSLCEYSDPSGTILQANYYNGSVSIYTVPAITSQPSDRTLKEGQSTSFAINATGQGLSYQWQIRTAYGTAWQNLTNGEHYSSVNGRQLNVNNVTLAMNGNHYRCVVSGTCPSPVTSEEAMLTVEVFIPTIVTSTGSAATCADMSFSIPVMVTNCNNVGAISLVLHYNAALVTYFGYENVNDELAGGTLRVNAVDGTVYITWASANQVLNIGDATLLSLLFTSKSGNSSLTWEQESCEYSNPLGEALPMAFSGSNLTIYYPPTINSNPVNQKVVEGNNTTFSISASGQGMAYQWQLSQDGGLSWEDLVNGDHYAYVNSNTLRVNNVVMTMSGYRFRCAVGGTCQPPVVSEDALLIVEKFVPTIHTSIGSQTICSETGFSIPVSVQNFIEVGAVSLALNYNDEVLTFTGYEGLNPVLADGQLQVNAAGGTVFVSWISLDGATIEQGNLISLSFVAVPGSSPLNWNTTYCEYANTLGEVIPMTFSNGNINVGDLNFTIDTQPTDQTILWGESGSFAITTTGQGLSFQWQISQDAGVSWSNLSSGGHYANVNTRTLGVNNVVLEMDGFLYRCVVNGACGVQYSESAMLKIQLPADFFEVRVTASPSNGGSVSGGAVYQAGQSCTVNASAHTGWEFVSWTENGTVVSQEASYTFLVQTDRNLVANFSVQKVNIIVNADPAGSGTFTGTGTYNYGDHVLLTAYPAEGFEFFNWTENDNVISSNRTISFTATGDRTLVAHFFASLPELHVTSISHSDFIAGQQASVTWTVQNDGDVPTPGGEVWYDRVWLSVESRVAADDNGPILLGEFPNVAALDPGEYYTQTQYFDLPLTLSGPYYLFVITDAYDCHHIYWENDEVPMPYSPPPFVASESAHCSGSHCGNGSGNRIYEMSEYRHGNGPGGSYHDNFFYDYLTIEVPPLPDLRVTNIIAPDNFYSGTTVSVTATIRNQGEANTNVSRWTDALYISTSETFDASAMIYLGAVTHNGGLAPNESYEVVLSGSIPINMFGPMYFYVYTDLYGQVYEHVANDNNVSRSQQVNVILTPPADLVPIGVSCPSTVSTGQTLNYSFTIYNQGAGHPNTGSWNDKVYFCSNPDSLVNAMHIRTIYHNNGLAPDDQYMVGETIGLPSNISEGSYYIYVVTDADNQVFEYLYEDNNTYRSTTPFTVIKPDLTVTNILADALFGVGQSVSISYTLKNQGAGAIENVTVNDVVYLSPTENLSGAVQIASASHALSLGSDQTVTYNISAQVPEIAEGTYYLFVLTDTGNALNESVEDNNSLYFHPVSVEHQPLPDLTPSAFTVPSVIQAGEEATVEFDVNNIGDAPLFNTSCNIEVYAQQNGAQILCPMQSQSMPPVGNLSIPVNGTVHFNRVILVPTNVTSDCHSFRVVVDTDNRIKELDENNNAATCGASVLNSPLPDLLASGLSIPVSVQAGAVMNVTFVVTNEGEKAWEANDLGATVVMQGPEGTISCPVKNRVEPAPGATFNLGIGESVTMTLTVLAPPTLNSTYHSLTVTVDPSNSVYESDESNNTVSATASVTDYPYDLELVSIEAPSEMWAGDTYSVSWTVKNVGGCPADGLPMFVRNNGYQQVTGAYLPTPWVDRLMLSFDDTWSNDDMVIIDKNRTVVLNPDYSYTVTVNVTAPYSMVGEVYLLVKNDINEITFDVDRSNNVLAQPLTIVLGETPDLRMTVLEVDAALTTDRTYTVVYSVVNEGIGATNQPYWKDAFYIGLQNYTVEGAYFLADKTHSGTLEPGESFIDSIEVTVPSSLSGDYFLLGFTDATDLVYEHNDEDDNLLSAPVTITLPLPCDLTVVNPDYPSTMSSGETVTVSWTLYNVGNNAAIGRIRDAVYLSADENWSSDDVMLGYVETNIHIEAQGEADLTLTAVAQGVPEGTYYVIIRDNILHALNEASYDNNTLVCPAPVTVGYPILAIGSSVDCILESGQYIYYKIEVGPEFDQQTLSLTMSTGSAYPANGLYLAYESAPSMSMFDFCANTPYEEELEILIPALQTGDYYLMAHGAASNGQPQQITLSATIINFEILHVNADHGSNTGSLTTQVLGAKFDSIMDFRLMQGEEYLPAEKVFFSNSTESFVTFNLKDVPTGMYDVVAELPGGLITVKDGAFTVEEGLPAELSVNIIAPSSVRNGNTFTVNIEYGNIGTTDLNVSALVVVSRNGHPIALESDELHLEETMLQFETGEPNGNPDVMRPGMKGTRTIFVKANNASTVSIGVFAIRNYYY